MAIPSSPEEGIGGTQMAGLVAGGKRRGCLTAKRAETVSKEAIIWITARSMRAGGRKTVVLSDAAVSRWPLLSGLTR